MSTPSLRDELIASGLASLKLARDTTNAMLDGLEGDQLTHRPCTGGQHALHILGHLAFSDAMTVGLDDDAAGTLPDGFKDAFGMGAVIKDTAADYPPVDVIRAQFTQKREAVIAWLEGLDEQPLLAPLDGPWAEFGRNRAHLPHTLAWHEGTHSGQLSQVRRSLGLAHKF